MKIKYDSVRVAKVQISLHQGDVLDVPERIAAELQTQNVHVQAVPEKAAKSSSRKQKAASK